MQVHTFILKLVHAEYSNADGILKRTPYYARVLRFRLQVLLPMDTHTSSRRALKLAQEQEVTEDWRWPRNERETELEVTFVHQKKNSSKLHN